MQDSVKVLLDEFTLINDPEVFINKYMLLSLEDIQYFCKNASNELLSKGCSIIMANPDIVKKYDKIRT